MSWLVDSSKWPVLAQRLRASGEFALDSETYNQPNKTSPQHRTRIHCWSVAALTGRRHPRGHRVATGVVLPHAALSDPSLREVLADPGVRKWAHNAPHDYHSLVNEGLEVNGTEDTLQWLRVHVPGMRDYGLKGAGQWALGKPPRPTFLEMVSHTVMTERVTHTKVKRCACGKQPCRARATSTWFDPDIGFWRPHTREEISVPKVTAGEHVARYEVTDFVPGAQLDPLVWRGQTLDRVAAWEEYALADAVDAMELVSWLRNRPVRRVPYPW